MKIFIAGATGAIGGALIPQSVQAGHEVAGTTRKRGNLEKLGSTGAEPVLMDGLDPDSVMKAIEAFRPDVIVNQMTALGGGIDFRKMEESFHVTNRLRTEGHDNLLKAAAAIGGARLIGQSYAGWPYEPTGGPIKSEDDPLDPDPPAQLRPILDAIRSLEATTTAAGGVVLRYGGFYGPGTGMAPGGDQWNLIRNRKMPVVGDGGGIWSFIHTEDAASATLAAIENYEAGEIFNVVDDDPAPVSEWLPLAARTMGAKPPRHVPRWVGRLAAGAHGVAMMCDSRGASNEKAKRELGWSPAHPSLEDGLREMV